MGNSYPPLSAAHKELKIKWYRSPVESSKLREMARRSNIKGGIQALGHLGLFLITGTLVFWMWSRQNWGGFAIAMFIHGTVSSFFIGVAPHELAHGTVFRTKWLNKIFLNLFSTISMWNQYDYAMSHTYHHRYTLHPDGDREVLLPLKPKLGAVFLIQMFTVNIYAQPGRSFTQGGIVSTILNTIKSAFGIQIKSQAPRNVWIRALHYDNPKQAKKTVWWSRWLLLFHFSVLAVSILTGYWVFSIIITVGPFTANIFHYLTGLAQHCGLQDNNADFRKNARSIKLGPVLSFLYWHMNWHSEHHMYAAVPCYNLKKMSQVIAGDVPEPRSLLGAWQEMRETWKRQKIDPGYQFDLELPSAAVSNTPSNAGVLREDGLVESIGELAPEETV